MMTTDTPTTLANEFGTTPYELRAWADDLIPAQDGDDDPLPADVVAILREAHAAESGQVA
jgi:hypothetical protein